jgi:hypothetical protein
VCYHGQERLRRTHTRLQISALGVKMVAYAGMYEEAPHHPRRRTEGVGQDVGRKSEMTEHQCPLDRWLCLESLPPPARDYQVPSDAMGWWIPWHMIGHSSRSGGAHDARRLKGLSWLGWLIVHAANRRRPLDILTLLAASRAKRCR